MPNSNENGEITRIWTIFSTGFYSSLFDWNIFIDGNILNNSGRLSQIPIYAY